MSGVRGECAPQEKSDARPEARSFLDGVLKRYATAKSYHIELVEETQLSGELMRRWERRSETAVVLPDKRCRFEAHSDMGWGLQISDGVTEWIYLPQSEQYTKGPAPASVPGPVPKIPIHALNSILDAQRILGAFSGPRLLIRSASYLPDEKIDVDGRYVLCTVVQGKGAVPGVTGAKRKINTTFTFWIDKNDNVIWKESERREGPLFPEQPNEEYTMDRTEWFKVSKPDAQTAPLELFIFKPSSTAKLVNELENPVLKSTLQLQGKQVAVKLGTKDGQTLALESFQGKPVLLDFWATWCAPCVESLPAVEKLYSETSDKGLVLLSIDDDDDAQTAAEFLAKRKEPWLNFHLTNEIAEAFPAHGIPYFVLVDASGKVVYSSQGRLDEVGLRAAVAKLGPEFAGVSQTSQPLSKP